jgi:hypothetical protein
MKKLRGFMLKLIKTFSHYCLSLFDCCIHIKVFSSFPCGPGGYLNKLMRFIIKPSDINVFHTVKISDCIQDCQVVITENN